MVVCGMNFNNCSRHIEEIYSDSGREGDLEVGGGTNKILIFSTYFSLSPLPLNK